jgi:pre-mRNA 3'-end-processing factor FIP1
VSLNIESQSAPANTCTSQSRSFRGIKPEAPAPTASLDPSPTQQSHIKTEASSANKKRLVTLQDGSKYPEVRTSSIDVNATPMWDPAGKLITEVDIDADLAEHTKPWRLPGTDQTDFFNYGFDEFSWVSYCSRQNDMASTINNQKNQMSQFANMFGGAMPGQPAPAPPQAAQGGPMAMAMPGMAMPGMPDPETMAACAAHLQSQGIDASQLDFSTFMQHLGAFTSGGQGGGYGAQSMQQQTPNQGYGGQQQQQQQQQQQSYQQHGNQGFQGGPPQSAQQAQPIQGQGFDGYSQQQLAMMQQGGIPSGPSGGGGGGGGGRGRGRGRRWQ